MIEVTGGSFTTTLEPKSISTFTSSPELGGKQNNMTPIAQAGLDMNLSDVDGDGVESVSLDGSESSDADGEIVKYSWAFNNEQLVWTATHELQLPIGEHVLVLTVTDNDGARHMDTLNVSVQGIYNTTLWFDAECGEVGTNWKVFGDPSASNEKYITTPSGVENSAAAPTDEADIFKIPFTITETTNYKIWARVITPSANDDSFWVKVDDGEWVNWNGIPASSDWHWDDVHDGSNENPVIYALNAGEHTLSIGYREDGAMLDKIAISNTGVAPTGLGEIDDKCVTEEPQPTAIGDRKEKLTSMAVFPNPAKSEITVTSKMPFHSLIIYSTDGKKLAEEHFVRQILKKRLSLDLAPGLYFIKIFGKSSNEVAKVIIE